MTTVTDYLESVLTSLKNSRAIIESNYIDKCDAIDWLERAAIDLEEAKKLVLDAKGNL